MDISYLELQGERLIEELKNVTAELKRVQANLDMLCSGWAVFDEAGRREPVDNPGGQAYPYIPYDLASYVELMVDLHHLLKEDPKLAVDGTHRPVRFLEVGCGMGRNLLLLKRSGMPFVVEGIDCAEQYLELGRKHFGLDRELIHHDARTFDYSPYDVVYVYRPFRDDAMELGLERRIMNQLRPGAYVVSPMGMMDMKPAGFEAVWDYRVWRKISPENATATGQIAAAE